MLAKGLKELSCVLMPAKGLKELSCKELEDVPLVELMYLVADVRMRVTVGDSGLCRCTCVTYFER